MYTDEEIGKSVQCSLENNEFFEQNAYREKRVSNLNDYFRYLAHSLTLRRRSNFVNFNRIQ